MYILPTGTITALTVLITEVPVIAQIRELTRPPRDPQPSDAAWVIGLGIASILALVAAGWAIARLRKWRKELGQTSSGSFDLTQMKEMQAKGLISQQEYEQLKKAYINSNK